MFNGGNIPGFLLHVTIVFRVFDLWGFQHLAPPRNVLQNLNRALPVQARLLLLKLRSLADEAISVFEALTSRSLLNWAIPLRYFDELLRKFLELFIFSAYEGERFV